MRPLGKKPLAFLIIGIVLVTGVSVFWFYESNRTQFRFEEWNPEPNRRILMYIRDLTDANLTISFVNDTTLMCSVDVELYGPQSGSVTWYRGPNNNVALESTGRQRRVEVVLGTAAKYDLYIQRGQNLNTTVRFENGAVLNKTRFEVYQTGIIRVAVDEDDGLATYEGLILTIEKPYGITGNLFVLLDVNLPEGYDGYLYTSGAPISFVERVGWGYMGNDVYATSADPGAQLISIYCYCTSIIARLMD